MKDTTITHCHIYSRICSNNNLVIYFPWICENKLQFTVTCSTENDWIEYFKHYPHHGIKNTYTRDLCSCQSGLGSNRMHNQDTKTFSVSCWKKNNWAKKPFPALAEQQPTSHIVAIYSSMGHCGLYLQSCQQTGWSLLPFGLRHSPLDVLGFPKATPFQSDIGGIK